RTEQAAHARRSVPQRREHQRAVGYRLVARHAQRPTDLHYRSQLSSAVARSVFSSRYFTMTGVWSESPSPAAQPPFTARAPGTTTAPAGISSGDSPLDRYTVSRTRSNTGVPRVSTTPAASTARARTTVP